MTAVLVWLQLACSVIGTGQTHWRIVRRGSTPVLQLLRVKGRYWTICDDSEIWRGIFHAKIPTCNIWDVAQHGSYEFLHNEGCLCIVIMFALSHLYMDDYRGKSGIYR